MWGQGAVPQTGRLDELLEEQAEEMVQLGGMLFIKECTVKKVDQKVRNLNQRPSDFTIF